MNCRFVATDEPRVVKGRHDEDCPGEACEGCQPCTEPHCRVCGRTHADGTCAECLAETREDLHEIAARCGALSPEVLHRGIRSEAMTLLGPTVDPERWGHTAASYLSGRLPEGWIETGKHGKECPLLVNEACLGCGGSELHPLLVLGTWDMCWRAELEHDDAEVLTVASAVEYLDRQMTYMAGYEDSPFEDFARDLRRCRAHLESVLHDARQGDRANVGCFECGGSLERRLTERDGFEDFWTCQRCHRRYTQAEYNFALRAKLEEASA
jgi:hypothetical protein